MNCLVTHLHSQAGDYQQTQPVQNVSFCVMGTDSDSLADPLPARAMFVVNRRGEKENVSFDEILNRIQKLSYGLHPLVDPPAIAQAVINGVRQNFAVLQHGCSMKCLVSDVFWSQDV